MPPSQLCWQNREWGIPAHPHPACAGAPSAPPTWWSRLQGCPVTTDQAQRRLQTPSRQAGAIWLQEAAGQKNKSQGKLGSRQSRLCRARCGRSRTARGPCRAPAPQPHVPADHQHLEASPAAAVAPLPPGGRARVKGGGTGYTLTTAPRHLPPATSCHGGHGDHQHLPGGLWGALGAASVGAEHREVLGDMRRRGTPLRHPP